MHKAKQRFSHFMINENRAYLSQKIGDITTATESLHDDASHLSPRKLSDLSKGIVDQIRKIIKSSWPDTEGPTLKLLQKFAGALAKTADEGGDLKELLGTGIQELQKLTNKLKMPINDLASNAEYDDSNED